MVQSIFTKFIGLICVLALIIGLPTFFLTNEKVPSAQAQPAPVTDLNPASPIQMASLSLDNSLRDTQTDRVIVLETDTAKLVAKANKLVRSQHFSQAIDVLKSVQEPDKNNYEVQLLLAKVLSWSGKYDKAEAQFQNLNALYPDNSDALLSYAYLKLYQNKHSQAETLFEAVLEKHPHYQDAKTGLEKARLSKS